MYAIKGGWGGRTLALAKSNEPGEGRKSRIRRSKEERKEMVESFIKKYQSLNNGNFPSLNLTHKEVGGSFYTVREIFRELIQENRVLGPGKLLLDEQNADQSFMEYPLGTLSLEPESSSLSPNGSHFVLFQHQRPQGLEDEQNINGSNAMADRGSHVKQEFIEVQATEALETEKNMVEVARRVVAAQLEDVEVKESPPQIMHDQSENLNENHGQETVLALEESEDEKLHLKLGNDGSFGMVSADKFSPMNNIEAEILADPSLERNSSHLDEEATENPVVNLEAQKGMEDEVEFEDKGSKMGDVIVETFPLKAVIDLTDCLDAKSGEVSKTCVEDKGDKEVIMGADMDGSLSEGIRDSRIPVSLNAKEAGDTVQFLLEGDALLVEEKVEQEPTDQLLGSSSSTANEGTMHGSTQLDMNANLSNNSIATAEVNVVEIPSSVATKAVTGANVNANSGGAAKEEFFLEIEDHDASAKEGGKVTLERINLESLEGSSTKQETNPLLAMIQSFVSAFMKLWSE